MTLYTKAYCSHLTSLLAFTLWALSTFTSVSAKESHPLDRGLDETKQYLVGFAQDTMNNDWRRKQVEDVRQELEKHPNIHFIHTDAKAHTATQILDIEDLLERNIDVLITSPRDVHALNPIIDKVIRHGIPVILLSRRISSNKQTLFIGGNNKLIGQKAAHYIAGKLNGKGRVLILEGVASASTTMARTAGFMEVISNYQDIKVVANRIANYDRAKAIIAVDEVIHQGIKFDAIYAHSDSMATGARIALEHAEIDPGSLIIVSIDYIAEAREAIRNGKQNASFSYPTGGKEGAQYVVELLAGKPVPKEIILDSVMVTRDNVDQVAPIF